MCTAMVVGPQWKVHGGGVTSSRGDLGAMLDEVVQSNTRSGIKTF
jgi:hypothetical protein